MVQEPLPAIFPVPPDRVRGRHGVEAATGGDEEHLKARSDREPLDDGAVGVPNYQLPAGADLDLIVRTHLSKNNNRLLDRLLWTIGLDACETPRSVAFCDYTIRESAVLVTLDASRDPRFRDNPLVTPGKSKLFAISSGL